MIPEFPRFKHLDIDDNEAISTFGRNYPPYSDFNVLSLYSYDTKNDIEISLLCGNLVIYMRDYITGKHFYSFLGSTDVADTARTLLNRSQEVGIEPVLRLIPQVSIDALLSESSCELALREDPGSFDYIYCLEQVSALSGSAFRDKRSHLANFGRKHPTRRIKPLDLKDACVRAEIERVLTIWQENKGRSDSDVEIEFAAIRRCLAAVEHFTLTSLGLFVEDTLYGFAIVEVIHGDYVMAHFLKADPNCKHAGETMLAEMFKAAYASGCRYMNCQQDLGIPGLRSSKQSWRPSAMLKKYVAAWNDNPPRERDAYGHHL